jgi:mannose-6-phosphate isomerase class I
LSQADFADLRLARRILKTASNNFVERPWGGTLLRQFKGLCPLPDQVAVAGSGIGESFEISAFDDDPEAARYPGRVVIAGGASSSLPALLKAHGEALLGQRWIGQFGPVIPLLPKFLNVRELLSVQGHPPGHTEAYVVVDAEPGATIRLGFGRDIDADDFRRRLLAGVTHQRELAELLGSEAPWIAVQQTLAPWLADRRAERESLIKRLGEICSIDLAGARRSRAQTLLESLKDVYWHVLDSMNEISLEPGQVIYNANPQRVTTASGRLPAAEVHALGNPEQREFVLLEVRRPGPTLRAWDNVRFPLRGIDIDAALGALNLEATAPEEFFRSRIPSGDSGLTLSVDSPFFRIEHIEIGEGESFELTSPDTHVLHVLAGGVELEADEASVSLRRGESAFVPFGVRSYLGRASGEGVHLVRVSLP